MGFRVKEEQLPPLLHISILSQRDQMLFKLDRLKLSVKHMDRKARVSSESEFNDMHALTTLFSVIRQ